MFGGNDKTEALLRGTMTMLWRLMREITTSGICPPRNDGIKETAQNDSITKVVIAKERSDCGNLLERVPQIAKQIIQSLKEFFLDSSPAAQNDDVYVACQREIATPAARNDNMKKTARNDDVSVACCNEIATAIDNRLVTTSHTLALVLVLILAPIFETFAVCNGATSTTAGRDENGNYCGSWDCGAQGNNITCTLKNGTLTISGEGEMRDYTQSGNWTCETCYPKMFNTDAPWAGKMITKAMVEGNVTKIGQFTFAGETYLTEISGMKNIKSIGRSAFNRTGLLSIDIPNVLTLDHGAFHKALNLQYVNMKDDVILLNNDWVSDDSGTFAAVDVVKNSCVSNPETGMKTCGSCGDKYVKAGTGCVSECGSGYHTDFEAKRCIEECANGQVEYKGECLDEYPFSRKHWTPSEAAKWLNEDNNTVTLTFKKQ